MKARLRLYWRIDDEKKIRKMYRKGWRARHMQWDPAHDRVIILWEKDDEVGW